MPFVMIFIFVLIKDLGITITTVVIGVELFNMISSGLFIIYFYFVFW